MASDPLKQTRRSIPDLLLDVKCPHHPTMPSKAGIPIPCEVRPRDCDDCIQIVMDELTARDAEIARLREQLVRREANLVALRTAVWKHAAAMESWRDRSPNARLGRWCISELRAIAACAAGMALVEDE